MADLDISKLSDVESITLHHYNQTAEDFWVGTKDHDVKQNYQALLSQFPPNQSLSILDFGCGPGRDVKYFKSLGHKAIGLDGCPSFCEMARSYSGCDIWHQSFLSLTLPDNYFDAVFANASLFHVPSAELPRVLKELHAILKPNGILFTSNPRGQEEGWFGERFGHYMELDVSTRYYKDAGFEVIDHYYRPEGKPRNQQPWLAMVSRCLK
jgi:SAM-dependent methyltransferase